MKDLFSILQDELSKLPVIDGATYDAGVKLVSAPYGGYFVFHVGAKKPGKPELLLTYRVLTDDAFRDADLCPHASHLRQLVTRMTDDLLVKWGVQ